MIRSYKNFINSSEFLKNFFILMTGSGVAALIPMLVSPVLTRLYSPSDMGVFALFLTFTTIVGNIICLRYEVAIILPKYKHQSFQLVIAALAFGIINSIVILIIIFFFSSDIATYFGHAELSDYLFFLPLTAFGFGLVNLLNYTITRFKNYSILAKSKIINSGLSSIVKILVGLKNGSVFGLIIGQLVGCYLSCYYLVRKIKWQKSKNISLLSWRSIQKTASRHKEYALYGTPATLLGGLSADMHIILFSLFYEERVVGYIALATSIFMVPLRVIGGSFGQVFYENIAHTSQPEQLLKKYDKAMLALSTIGCFLVLAIWMVPAGVIAFIFGEEWRGATEFLKILVIMFVLKFITSPLSSIFFKTKKNNYLLISQIVNVLLVSLSVYIPFRLEWSSTNALLSYTISSFAFYLAILFLGRTIIVRMVKGVSS